MNHSGSKQCASLHGETDTDPFPIAAKQALALPEELDAEHSVNGSHDGKEESRFSHRHKRRSEPIHNLLGRRKY